MLRSFTGFRGVATALEIDGIQFVLLARDAADLQRIYDLLMPPGTLREDMTKKSILINASLLPDHHDNEQA